MTRRLRIFNGQVITGDRIIEGGTVLAEGGRILSVTESGTGDNAGEDRETVHIDARGQYVSPGFIDIHVHGGGGSDFMDGSKEAFLEIARLHARYGTTSMVPTTLSGDRAHICGTLELYEAANKENALGAQFLGMHLEGPYFAMNQRGAQDPRYIRNPDPEEYNDILDRFPSVRRWSVAPELTGALEMGRNLRSRGVLGAIAHTDAVYEEVQAACANGYSLVTHLYSGMSGVSRRNAFRYAGVIESAYLLDELNVEIIADGIHLPAPLLQLAYKIKGPDRIVLVTDAMRGAGMPPGPSVLGNRTDGLPVIVEDGVAKLPDRSAFAGSVATADRLVRTMITLGGVPLEAAVRMMSRNPALIMGVGDRKGMLSVGMDADIVIFDEQIRIDRTIIGGTIVYEAPPTNAAQNRGGENA
jgi:N-acetylglucosamine-6-phosphate deacetylase